MKIFFYVTWPGLEFTTFRLPQPSTQEAMTTDDNWIMDNPTIPPKISLRCMYLLILRYILISQSWQLETDIHDPRCSSMTLKLSSRISNSKSKMVVCDIECMSRSQLIHPVHMSKNRAASIQVSFNIIYRLRCENIFNVNDTNSRSKVKIAVYI